MTKAIMMSDVTDRSAPFKFYNYVSEVKTVKDDKGGEWYKWLISDNTKDRGRDVVPIKSWELDNYNKNGIVLYMHSRSDKNGTLLEDTYRMLGPGKVYIEDGKLMGLNKFEPKELNPLAHTIKGKVDFGTIKAVSVGYDLKEGHWGKKSDDEDPDYFYFDKAELLEFSIVDIPMNPNALAKMNGDSWSDVKAKFPKPETKEKTKSDINVNIDTDTLKDVLKKNTSQHAEMTEDEQRIDEAFIGARLSFLKHKNLERCLND